MNDNTSLLNYWKTNGGFIKNRVYPNVGYKDWNEATRAILTKKDPAEIKILNAIENAPPPSNSEVAIAGAYSPELGGNVVPFSARCPPMALKKCGVSAKSPARGLCGAFRRRYQNIERRLSKFSYYLYGITGYRFNFIGITSIVL